MEFDFNVEEKKLNNANENIKGVMNRYEEVLSNLSDEKKNVLLLHFCFKKLETLNKMKFEINNWNDKREECLQKIEKLVEVLGHNTFSDDSLSLKDIKENVDSYMKDPNIKPNIKSIVTDFSSELKNVYEKECGRVYTVLPIPNLKELNCSLRTENQYLNNIYNGVFATSTINEIYKYIARSNVGGMRVQGKRIIYPSNPFLDDVNDGVLTLINPVSLYYFDVDQFEPQFDFDIGEDNKPHFIYGGEWVAPREKLKCEGEVRVSYLPSSFIENNNVYYNDNGNEVPIKSQEKTL